MSTPEQEPCSKFEPVTWRTPNQWWFVAVCQSCGRCATSIQDGGASLRDLADQHGIPKSV